MKKYITTLALAVAVSLPAFAQNEKKMPVADRADAAEMKEGYSKMLKAKYNVELRKVAITALGLTEEQTTDFTPLLMDYLEAKEDLMVRRNKLIKEHKEEMAEDNSARSEENEKADFVENYWELDIDEMETKKDFFDRFEDAITTKKALQFFTLENMFQDRIQRSVLMETLPTMIMLEPVAYTYSYEINDFNNWKKVNIDGKVGLDHEFTYNGLKKLLTAAETMVAAEGIYVPNFPAKKKAIMNKASMLKKDWTSLKHADHARDAFQNTASVLAEIARDNRFDVSEAMIKKLDSQANMIKDQMKLTDQADHVYNFFDTAESIINELVQQANYGARK